MIGYVTTKAPLKTKKALKMHKNGQEGIMLMSQGMKQHGAVSVRVNTLMIPQTMTEQHEHIG